MKKFILLLLIPLFLGGCYDYNGLNDLAIISGIAIDYEDDEFKVTFEVISTKKKEKQVVLVILIMLHLLMIILFMHLQMLLIKWIKYLILNMLKWLFLAKMLLKSI